MTDQQAPERIWFYADPIAGWLGSAKQFLTPDGLSTKHYVRADLLEAAEKRIAELEAELKEVRLYREWWSERAEEAEAERDQALASVGAVIEMAAAMVATPDEDDDALDKQTRLIASEQLRCDFNPDATAALNEMLADAWQTGFDTGFSLPDGDYWDPSMENPYRKDREDA